MIAGWTLGIAALIAGVAYICDSLYFQRQMKSANSADAFGNVQFYPATKLKNGKLDIYLESPENEVCVHALFPHNGYNPCWYAKRNPVHVVAGNIVSEDAAEAIATMQSLQRFSDNSSRHQPTECSV